MFHLTYTVMHGALIRSCDDWPATITHVPVAAVLVLNTPDDGCLRPKHVERLCRNQTCTVLHQVGVSFDLYCDARKHKIKTSISCWYVNRIWQVGQIPKTFNSISTPVNLTSPLCGRYMSSNDVWTDSDHWSEQPADSSLGHVTTVLTSLRGLLILSGFI